MSIPGSYLNGKTSRRHEARLEVSDASSLCISVAETQSSGDSEVGGETIALEFRDLHIETRLGDTPRELSFGDGQLFVTEENDAIDALIAQFNGGKTGSLIHRMESNVPIIILAALAALALLAGMVLYGIPKTAEVVAHQLPDFATDQLGSGLDLLDQTLFDPSELSESRQDEIRTLFALFRARNLYRPVRPLVPASTRRRRRGGLRPDAAILRRMTRIRRARVP